MIDTSSPAPRSRGLATRLTKVFNRLTLPLSGTRWFGLWAVLRHRGRRSGKEYSTPVAARRTADGFVISLAFGDQVDWLRNIQAAGECVIGWKGRDYRELDPEVVGWEQAKSAFTPVQQLFLRVARIKAFVQVRDAPASA
jgi:deazaflavin-dependent oxidoreductase (nitroreductase family)